MELRHLRYFVTVAEELHFGRAARRLHMSQPPLSQQIAALEEEIGARLLERSSRSVALTEAGRAFLGRARDILEASRRAADEARAASQGLRGRLAVGFVGPAVDGLLPPAILAFGRETHDVVLELSEMGSLEQLEALDAGRLDVGFVRAFGAGTPPRGTSLEVLVRERYVAALPSGHALAKRRVLDLADMSRIPLIMYPRRTGPALYDAVMAALERAGARPAASQEARSKHVAVALVAAGLGAALVPESTARAGRAGVVFRPVRDPAQGPALPLVEIAMAFDARRVSPALERFMDAVRAQADTLDSRA